MADSDRSIEVSERGAQLAALLARTALGDQRAFAELYRQTGAHLYAVAVRIVRNGSLAEEILQEAFVSVWHHAGAYEAAKSQPITWLVSIVRNRCLDLLRKREVDTVTLSGASDEDAGDAPAGKKSLLGSFDFKSLLAKKDKARAKAAA